jgi:hypothetical protein
MPIAVYFELPPGTTGSQDIKDFTKHLVMGYFGWSPIPDIIVFDDG